MKCERCNTKIKKGELFCSKCGAKQKNLNETNTIEIEKIKEEKDFTNDVVDLFYSKDMDKKEGTVNWLLVILIILLIGFIVYLIFFDNYFIKKDSNNEDVLNTVETVNVIYNNISLELDNSFEIKYNEKSVILSKEGMITSIYMVRDKYGDITKDIHKMILKWNEFGLKVTSNKEIDKNTYEIIGTYKYNDYLLYIYNFNNYTVIIESSFYTTEKFNTEKEYIKNIISSIKAIDNDYSVIMYPEFNLEPIGSQ